MSDDKKKTYRELLASLKAEVKLSTQPKPKVTKDDNRK